MTPPLDRFRLHAYVDGELTPDEAADVERHLVGDRDALLEVAALRGLRNALHARYDHLLAADERPAPLRHRLPGRPAASSGIARGFALAATVLVALVVGGAAGWTVRGHLATHDDVAAGPARGVESRLQSFVQTAALSHAVFVPEVRHPVEVPAADEAHLVAWLSKRLAAPLVVPHLGDAGWSLLGGRLLAGENGPVAQFMYQDRTDRRMTLAVSKSVAGPAPAGAAVSAPPAAFRIADEGDNTVFYWIDADYAYALTGRLSRAEMTDLARRVYAQLDGADRRSNGH